MLPGVTWEVSKMHVWEERLVRNCENGLNPDAKLLEDKKFEAKLCEQAVGIWQGQNSAVCDETQSFNKTESKTFLQTESVTANATKFH